MDLFSASGFIAWLSSLPGEYGLSGVALSAFLSSTVLPGTSEAAAGAWLLAHPGDFWPTLAAAGTANTAGAMTTYLLGRLLPERKAADHRALESLRRWGAPALLLTWVPVVGDALSGAAGWLRVPVIPATLYTAAGKFLRYAVLLAAVSALS